MKPGAHRSGFSLIELMVAITIIGLLVIAGTPAYTTWMANGRVRNAAESIQNGLRFARNQSVQLARPARFQLMSSGATWQVCLLAAATPTAACDAIGSEVVQQFYAEGGASDVNVGSTTVSGTAFTTDLSGSGSAGAGVTFNSLGRPSGTNPIVRIDAKATLNTSRRLVMVISPGGSVRMCDPALPTSNPQGCS